MSHSNKNALYTVCTVRDSRNHGQEATKKKRNITTQPNYSMSGKGTG